MKTNLIKIINYFLGILLLLSLIPFTFFSFNRNWLATIFVMIILIIMIGFKIIYLLKSSDKTTNELTYLTSYFSELAIIIAVILMGTIEIYRQAEVGLWFYVVLGVILISRPFFMWLLKK